MTGYRIHPLELSAELDYERSGSGIIYSMEDADGPLARCREMWQVLAWVLGPILFSELKEAQR